MVQQLKTYWIALLVIVLVSLHGAIVAMVRMEAIAAKQNASCEVELGTFRLTGNDSSGPLMLQLHSLSPVNHRVQSRRLIELNQFQVRQAIEQHLRQVPIEILSDPLLAELKLQLLEIMIQTVGTSACEEVLITAFQPVDPLSQWTFGSPSREGTPRVVITRREMHEHYTALAEEKIAEQHAADDGHGSGHGDDAHGGHGDDSHGGHGEPSHDDAHGGHEDHGGHGGGH